MNIKTKILIFNSILVILAVLITLFSVLYIINQGIEKQSEALLEDMRAQARQRTWDGTRLLQRFVYDYFIHLKRLTSEFCENTTVREGMPKGQWKAIFALADTLCKREQIDFLLVFDTNGRLQVCWPSQIDANYRISHIKEIPLFSNFEKYIDAQNLVDVPVFSLVTRWDSKTQQAYGVDIDNQTGLAVFSAGVIPNDFYDRPAGYVLTAVKSDRLFKTFADFFQVTHQDSLLIHDKVPLVWAGFPGGENDIVQSIQSLNIDQKQITLSNGVSADFVHAGLEYNIFIKTLNPTSRLNISISDTAAPTYLIVGQPTSLITEAEKKIKRESNQIEKYILQAALLIALLVLILTVFIVNFIGQRISKPIELAADISDKIAGGDLDHVLDESSPDETGRLFRSMNRMIKNLKNLRQDNERQLKALEENRKRNEIFLSAIHEGVVLADAGTNDIIDVNPAALAMIKAQHDDIVGTPYHRYFPPADEKETGTGRHDSLEGYADQKLVTQNGNQLDILKTIVPAVLDEGECLIISFIDVTPLKQAQEERQRLELQLEKAKKMEAIGLLAGGVAHDLNNILSGIVSYPDLLLLKLPEGNPLRSSILTIKESGLRAAAIVQDLLTLARRGISITEVLDLNDIITKYLKSPEYNHLKSYHYGIQVHTNLDKDLMKIMGSPVHLSKTIMNIIANAAEAMPSGGKIIISTENKYLDIPLIGYDDLRKGDYVVLKVTDTGIGMTDTEKERIFEPFYTKKVMGRSGTGLGMAVVWGTIKDHKGYIDIQSTKGKGSTFALYFPVTRKELTQDREVLANKKFIGHGETILVVDDDEQQREIAEAIFTFLGYKVSTASSGEQAIEFIKNTSVDLLVLDMVMDQGLDGLDTYRQIIQMNPKQKTIIASGFSESGRVKEAQSLGAGQYIRKPYTIENIGIAVRKELDK